MLKDLLTKELLYAFANDLKDTYKPFVLTRTEIIRDKRTDENTEIVTTLNGHGVFGSFTAEEADGSVNLITDTKLLIIQDAFAGKPVEGDYINGYRVISVSKDPADVTWVLGLRKTNGLEA